MAVTVCATVASTIYAHDVLEFRTLVSMQIKANIRVVQEFLVTVTLSSSASWALTDIFAFIGGPSGAVVKSQMLTSRLLLTLSFRFHSIEVFGKGLSCMRLNMPETHPSTM